MKKDILRIILIILSIFLLYSFTLNRFFYFEDIRWIASALKIEENVKNVFEPFPDLGFWRPLSVVVFLIQYKLFWIEPFYYNLTNLIFHAINSILIYILVILLFSKYIKENIRFFAFITSLFYGISFVHFEPVVDISALNEELGCFFLFLSLIFFLIHKSIFSKVLSVFFYTLALLSKESMIIFLMVLPLTDMIILKSNFRTSVKNIIPYFLVSVLYLIAFYLITDGGKSLKGPKDAGYFIGLHGISTLGRYLIGLFFSSFGFEKINLITIFYTTTIILILIFFVKLNFSKIEKRITILCFFWTVIALFPYIFYPYKEIIFGHRYFYLSSFGFLTFLSYIIFLELKEKFIFSGQKILMMFFVLFLIFSNVDTVRKEQITLKNKRDKVEFIKDIFPIINLHLGKKILVIVNFSSVPFLLYQRDFYHFIIFYLKGIKYFEDIWFTTEKELQYIALNYECVHNVRNAIFIEYKNNKLLDKTNYYTDLLKPCE